MSRTKTINNLKELRRLTEVYSYHNVKPGYICIGYGSAQGLDDDFNISTRDISSLNTAGDMIHGMFGAKRDTVYFVTETFYNQNIKETVEPTANTRESYTVAADKYIELMGIKKDSFVLITHKPEKPLFRYDPSWVDNMHLNVGKVFRVRHIRDGYINLADGFNYPFHVLSPSAKVINLPEPIRLSKDYDAKFNVDGTVSVGCQNIKIETVKQILEGLESVQKQLA